MTAATAKSAKTVTVRQVKSGIGYHYTQKATLKALGLAKIGRVRVHPDNPQIRGMIAKVSHLVVVEETGSEDAPQA